VNADCARSTEFFARMEPGMREFFLAGLRGPVKTKDVEGLVDIIRAWTDGSHSPLSSTR
jgi:hypothetical protein